MGSDRSDGRFRAVVLTTFFSERDRQNRALLADGTWPNSSIKKGQEMSEMLATDIALEAQAVKMYNDAAVVCAEERDQISKQLFEKLLGEEEEHLSIFENLKNHVDRLGGAYLAILTGD